MLLRHAAGYALGRGIPGLLSLAALVIYTRMLSPAEYGRYTLTIAVAAVIALLAFQWQRRVVARWLPAEPIGSKRLLGVTAGQFLVIAVGVVLTGIVVAVSPIAVVSVELILLGLTYLLVNSWFELNLTISAALLQPAKYGLILGSKTIIALVVGIGLVLAGWGASGVLIGLAVGCVLASGFFGRGFWQGVSILRPTKAELREHLRYGLPIAATLGLTWIIDSSDRLIIGALDSVEAAGQYAVGYDLANFSLFALMMIVQLPVQSIVLRTLESEGEDAARTSLATGAELIFGLSVAAAASLAVLAEPLADVVVGESFRAAVKQVLPIIALGAMLGSIKAFYFDLAFVVGKSSGGMMMSSGAAAALNLILNFLMIPRFGIAGAAWSTVIAFGVGLALSFRLGRNSFRMPSVALPLAKATVVGAIITVTVLPLRLAEISPATHLMSGLMLGGLSAAGACLILDIAGCGSAARVLLSNARGR